MNFRKSGANKRLLMFVVGCLFGCLNVAYAEDAEPAAEEKSVGSTNYVALYPAFVTNYGNDGKLHYLKAEITLRVVEEGSGAIVTHSPAIRHGLIMLLSRQDAETVGSASGKEQIRVAALEAVQAALSEEEQGEIVEDLLFTSFVVQR